MKYVIIGGRKCGTTSLEKFLKAKGMDVIRKEQLFTTYNGLKRFWHEYPEYQPILILRNPVDRAYSDWKYAVKDNRTKLSYREYCELKYPITTELETNPLIQSNYKQWLEPWKYTKLKVFQLEILREVKGFPNENSTPGVISEEDRLWTKEKLNEM